MKALKFPMLALGALAGGLLSSCTVNDTPADNSHSGSVLAKAPQVQVYSGSGTKKSYWDPFNGGTRGTDMDANMWNQTWDCPPRPAEDLTPEELAELKALLSKAVETHNTIVIPFENYYVQQIYKGEDRYNTHDRCTVEGCDHVNDATELGSDHMNKLVAYNPHEEQRWTAENNYSGAWEMVEYEHVNNFNNGTNPNKPGNCGCGESHFGTTLMTGMPTEGIDPEKQFGFHETWGTAHDYNNYIIVEYKGYYYVGFDYEAHKYDQTTHNHGEGLDIERDWNFTDWIVRITPAYHKGETPEGNPGGIIGNSGDHEVGDTCDTCGDSLEHHHDGICDDCLAEGRESGCLNGNGSQVGPGQDADNPGEGDDRHDNEVEVNLHGTDKAGDYLESHLSIHVRAATDVEVFIPIPKGLYCEADDMAIVMEHEMNHMYHGETFESSWTLKDSDLVVTLKISYEEDGIRITTDGITQEVIDWCMEKCEDGITFEIWNYFDPEVIDLETLKGYLNQATIRFLDECPDYYINAFTEENGAKDPDDCKVSIVDDQRDEFAKNPEIGEHLNGSTKNVIYENNDHRE